ncbi:hypothetical protein [Pseudodesulfovibrio mercurii]|uniref:hypothetical protein n=1 Tax=Pseudodesulfovibrio mercurii TaxID=641491 RepID=UPI0011D2C0CF|nr:hypothetical protein [Pseudodesulfovibrio mercurii]
MKKMIFPVIVLLLLFTWQLSLASDHMDMPKGEWLCYSEVICSFYGDMTIDSNTIKFKETGPIHYRIIRSTENQTTIELDRAPDCGRFIIIGPYDKNENFLDFSVYKTKEDALAVTDTDIKNNIHPKCCTWGLYDKGR